MEKFKAIYNMFGFKVRIVNSLVLFFKKEEKGNKKKKEEESLLNLHFRHSSLWAVIS